MATAASLKQLLLPGGRRSPRWSAVRCSSASTGPRKLALYSKPGCCLCDGLKEKLQAALSLPGPNPLHDVVLQVRDITTNPDWEKSFQYEIPVLAKLLPDGSEEILPRLSPRLGVELVQKKIAAVWTHSYLEQLSDPSTCGKQKTERDHCTCKF